MQLSDKQLADATSFAAIPLEPAAGAEINWLPYRVEAEWPGGGIGRTLLFPNVEAASAWIVGKAEAHPGATVKVEERDEAALLAIDRAYEADKASGAVEARRLARAVDLEDHSPAGVARAQGAFA